MPSDDIELPALFDVAENLVFVLPEHLQNDECQEDEADMMNHRLIGPTLTSLQNGELL